MSVAASPTRIVGQRGLPARLVLYLNQMFPPHTMIPYAVFHFFAMWFGLQALGNTSPLRVTWSAIVGAATVLLFLLLMRLYDELKDAATDIALGRAGDPLYRDRVLVTGAVRLEDVRLLRWLVTGTVILLNVRFRFAWASVAFWVLFASTWVSFHWFFWPKMSRYLLVAFITHNPLSLLVLSYVVALFVDGFHPARLDGSMLRLMIGLWLPLAAWETSRKIRTPADETSYLTYSRVLGWKVAALVPAVFVAVSASLLISVGRTARLGGLFQLAIAAAAAAAVFRCLQFRLAPTSARSNLKPWTMLFATVANAGTAIAAVTSKGIAW